MSEIDTSFGDALGVLGMLGRTVTVSFGGTSATGALVQAEQPLDQGPALSRKSQNAGYRLTLLAGAFPGGMPAEKDTVAIAETGLSYAVQVAPRIVTPLMTYELGAGFAPKGQ